MGTLTRNWKSIVDRTTFANLSMRKLHSNFDRPWDTLHRALALKTLVKCPLYFERLDDDGRTLVLMQ